MMPRKLCTLLSFLIIGLFFSREVSSQDAFPTELTKWKSWILRDDTQRDCLASLSHFQSKECIWPSSIDLKIKGLKGEFFLDLDIFSNGLVFLPGSSNGSWPSNVEVNGKVVPVVEYRTLPAISLKKGKYRITGQFNLTSSQSLLTLPQGIGLLSLQIDGKKILSPNYNGGRIWLRQSETKDEEDYLEIKIFRKITDSIPSLIETYLLLKVGGSDREVTLSDLLIDKMIPMSVDSNLPIQWKNNGKINLRLKKGQWFVSLVSRSESAFVDIRAPQKSPPYPNDEYWSFVSKNELRVVNISGAQQIDANALELPASFRGHPTYQVKKGQGFHFDQKSRGIKRAGDNVLHLSRSIWLDFAGEFYTVEDTIKGAMNKDWRLNMNPPYNLGSVAVNGQNRLITSLPNSDAKGFEIRETSLDAKSVSLLDFKLFESLSMGWDNNFKSTRGLLFTPPGWKTIAIMGADFSSGTWASRWQLLNIFLVLLISFGVFKVKGVSWGLISFFGLVLSIHEQGAPSGIWIHLLIAMAIDHALMKKNKASKLIKAYRGLCFLALITTLFNFSVKEIQYLLYPSLQKEHSRSFYSSLSSSTKHRGRIAKNEIAVSQSKKKAVRNTSPRAVYDMSNFQDKNLEEVDSQKWANNKLKEFDHNAIVQTGPGTPQWSWNQVEFSWDGPVSKKQEVRFILFSPLFNSFFVIIRLILLGLMAYCFLDLPNLKNDVFFKDWKKRLSNMVSIFLIILTPIFSLLCMSEDVAADSIPDTELLKEYKQYLDLAPKCYPHCLNIEKMHIQYSESDLVIRMSVHTLESGFFPLSGASQQWMPSKILVNGKKDFSLMKKAGVLTIAIDKGVNEIVMSGKIGQTQQLQIPIKIHPKIFTYAGKGWTLEGLNSDGRAYSDLSLSRIEKKTIQGVKKVTYEVNDLPAFVFIERSFHFQKSWFIRTTVTRRSSLDKAIHFKLPKLKGESLKNGNVYEKGDEITGLLASGQRTISFQSILEETTALELQATKNSLWFEKWIFVPSSWWNLDFISLPEDLNPISSHHNGNSYSPSYRPWPGEILKLKVIRPASAKGKSITLNAVDLDITPGRRMSSYKLEMSFLTSIGMNQALTLPMDSKLKSVSISGKLIPLDLKDGVLDLPLGVGKQDVVIHWEDDSGIKSFFYSPKIDLGIEGTNLKQSIIVGSGRWVLAVGGPVMGPAILFWGKLITLFILAFFLAKISWCPLSFTSWCLLFTGLTQGFNGGIFLVTACILVLAYRSKNRIRLESTVLYNLASFLTIGLSVLSVIVLIQILYNGLLGGPVMAIQGNNSSSVLLNWFVDHFDKEVPELFLLSLPTLAYQIIMLIWSLLMTFTLMKWTSWLWEGLYGEGVFKKVKIDLFNKK